jgi:hypothetical protein
VHRRRLLRRGAAGGVLLGEFYGFYGAVVDSCRGSCLERVKLRRRPEEGAVESVIHRLLHRSELSVEKFSLRPALGRILSDDFGCYCI